MNYKIWWLPFFLVAILLVLSSEGQQNKDILEKIKNEQAVVVEDLKDGGDYYLNLSVPIRCETFGSMDGGKVLHGKWWALMNAFIVVPKSPSIMYMVISPERVNKITKTEEFDVEED